MKLFIINGVLSNRGSGLVIIKAESLDKARDLFAKKFVGPDAWDSIYKPDFDIAVKKERYKVLDLADTDQEPAGFVQIRFGGG